MITRATPKFPEYTSREKFGIVLWFFSTYKIQNYQKYKYVLYCGACHRFDFFKHENYGCMCTFPEVKPEVPTLLNALKYVGTDILNHFLKYDPNSQFVYIRVLDMSSMAIRHEDPFSIIFFCNCCHTPSLFKYRDDLEYYTCYGSLEIGSGFCGSVYCVECVEQKNIVASRREDFSHYRWYYNCICRKHDTLFDALYTIIFTEGALQ